MDLYDVINYGVGASYVEVRWQRDVGTVAVLRNGVVEYVESYRQEGYGVRVLAGGGLGFAATTDADGLKTAVETAVKLARVGGRLRKRSIAFSEERLAKLRYSLPPVDLDPLEYLKNLDKVIENKVNVRRLFAAVWTTEKHIVTSDGADVYSKIPRAAVFAILIRHEPSLGSLQRFVARGRLYVDTLWV